MTPNPTEPEIVRVLDRLDAWMARGNRPGGMNVPDEDGTPSIQADLRTALRFARQAGLASRPESPYIEGYLTDRVNAGDRLDPRTGKIVNVLARPESGGVGEALAAIDAASKACPVEQSKRFIEKCPKCGATARDNCGPNVRALANLETAVRAALTHPSEPAQSLPEAPP